MPNRILDGRDKPIQRTGTRKPVIGILVTVLVAIIYYRLGDRPWIDLLSTFIIAVAFITAGLVIAIFTEDWKWRAVGLLIAVGGTGLSYAFLHGNAAGYTNINTLAVRSTLRSALSVGGVIFFIGIVGWGIERRRGNGQPLLDALDPRTNYRT